jgi:phospholipid/cholesterol/gamma-HCH transport system substrate-binding protein
MPRAIVRDFITGATALAGIGGLATTLMLFGELSGLGERRYEILAHVGSAAGLNDTSPVTLNGVKIGQIARVDVRADGVPGATLTLRIKDSARIPRAAVASIDKGLLGDAGLEFTVLPLDPATTPTPTTPANPLDPSLALAPGETIDLGTPMAPLERIARLVEQPLARLASTADSVDELARTYVQVGERINDLLEPRTPQEVAAGAAPNFRSTLARADAAIASAQVWLGDDQLRADARDTIARAKALADEFTTLSRAWTNTAQQADAHLADVAGEARELSDRASSALERLTNRADATLARADAAAKELQDVAARINRGEGTLGQLSTNPDLYRSLNSATQRLDKTLAELEALIIQFKTEGLDVNL